MPADRLIHPRAGKSHKISLLTDLEFRVWIQYLLSADDFGVMHATAIELQSKNLHLANRPAKVVQRCIDALVKCRLVCSFDHQGQPYICQHDWQDWQRVTWPSKTINPCPPANLLETFTVWTQLLFTVHPGARKAPKKPEDGTPERREENSSGTPEALQSPAEVSPSDNGGTPAPRARERAERLTANANGLRLTASEERLDLAFDAFRDAYPESRRKGGWHAQTSFVDQARKAGSAAVLMAALENHNASEQWATPKLIPGMDVWLLEERWRQTLPAKGSTPQRESGRSQPAWVQDVNAKRAAHDAAQRSRS